MFAILHFIAVKKSRHGNTFAWSETVCSEVVSLLPLSVRQPERAWGARMGDEGKAVGRLSADGFAYLSHCRLCPRAASRRLGPSSKRR
jgi:hypothetical protein